MTSSCRGNSVLARRRRITVASNSLELNTGSEGRVRLARAQVTNLTVSQGKPHVISDPLEVNG